MYSPRLQARLTGDEVGMGTSTEQFSRKGAPVASSSGCPFWAADSVWPLWLLALLAALLLAMLWLAVASKIRTEAVEVEREIELNTMNLARVFEEHTVRTLASADQALSFVKFQRETLGVAPDIRALTESGVIAANIYNQVGLIDADGVDPDVQPARLQACGSLGPGAFQGSHR